MHRAASATPIRQDESVPALFIPKELRHLQPENLYNLKEEFYWGSRLVLQPGMVVFDVGSYCGYLTALMAWQVGRRGRVVMFEVSQERLARAKKLALSNGAMNIDYVHARVSGPDDGVLHENAAPLSIDEYVAKTGIMPHLVKIDTGASGFAVLHGMQQTLAGQKPALLIHLDSEGGDVDEAVPEFLAGLERNGYRFIDLSCSELVGMAGMDGDTGERYLSGIYGEIGATVMQSAVTAAGHIAKKDRMISDLTEARRLVNERQFMRAAQILQPLYGMRPADVEINYLLACSLSETAGEKNQALSYYDRALGNGFDAGWVRYHRGILYKELGEYEASLHDLRQIPAARSEQLGVAALIETVTREMITNRLEQARAWVEEGMYAEALRLSQQCLDIDAAHAEFHYLAGFCSQMMGNEEAALSYYAEAEILAYDVYWVRYNRSAIYLAQDNVDAALFDLVKTRLSKPGDPALRRSLAKVRDAVAQKKPSLINGRPLYVPRGFQSILPLSPCDLSFDYEPLTLLGLDAVLRDDSLVFDVGASYGVISALVASAPAFRGQVVAFEPNPHAFLQANMLAAANGIDDSIIFEQIGVGACVEEDVEFFTLPGHQSVASTRNPLLKSEFDRVETLRVEMTSLQAYCAASRLCPHVIKLDVEGSEFIAIEGAMSLLEQHHPDLVIETHWQRIREIGGSLEMLCRKLEQPGYHLFDLSDGTQVSAGEYCRRYRNKIGYLLATFQYGRFDTSEELTGWLQSRLAEVSQRQETWDSYAKAREAVQAGQYEEALTRLRPFVRLAGDYAEAHYLTAYCLHQAGLDADAALEHYRLALQHGHDEFWVRFHRAFLFYDVADIESAYSDLQRAVELDGEHRAAADFLVRLAQERAELRLNEARSSMQTKDYEKAVELLSICLHHASTEAEANYLSAYCMQQMGDRARDAMVYYQVAMDSGYDPFWIYYHRALLLMDQGDLYAAYTDIKMAVESDPGHLGARSVLKEIRSRLGL